MKKVFLYFDYSQIELRCAAHVSQDPVMLQSYRRAEDLHLKTARAIYNNPLLTKKNEEERQAAKQTNFLLIYNGSAKRLQDQLWQTAGIKKTFEECSQYRKNFFNLYARYNQYLWEQKQFISQYKIAISPFGRIRRLPDIKFLDGLDYKNQEYRGIHNVELLSILDKIDPKDRFTTDFKTNKRIPLTVHHIAARKVRHAFNQGFNFPIQSMAASIIKRAMITLHKEKFCIKNNIHDALYIETFESGVDKDKKIVQDIMENVVKLSVPLVAECKVKEHF